MKNKYIYRTTQNEIEVALTEGKALLKDLPTLLRQMKQVATDLEAAGNHMISAREHEETQKRFEKLIDTIAKTSAAGRSRRLHAAFAEVEHSAHLIEESLVHAAEMDEMRRQSISPGRVASRYMQATKRFRLTRKEINRADEVVNSRGKTMKYTIITRPQADGGVLVAAIDVATGKPWGPTDPQVVKAPSRVDREITNILRWIDKMGWTSDMASSGRKRRKWTMQ